MFSKCHQIELGSPRTTENNEFSFININAICWTHKIASCHQPCRGGFTAKITSSPNTVCMVNHATEDLQHRILDFSKYHSLHCHKKMKEQGKRGDSDGGMNSTQSEKREKHKSNDNTGWQDGVLHM